MDGDSQVDEVWFTGHDDEENIGKPLELFGVFSLAFSHASDDISDW